MSAKYTPKFHFGAKFVVFSAAATALAVACGGEGQDDGGTSDSGTTAPGIEITGSSSTGSSTTGTTGGSISNSDGGRVDLTSEQVDEISEAACAGWEGEGESLPAVLQLVVDTSRSMTQNAPGSNASKWEETRDALLQAIETLPASVSVGVMFYPNTDDLRVGASAPSPITECIGLDGILPISNLGPAGSDQRTAISGGIRQVNPDGYTPTHDAYRYALNESLIPYPSSASKFMLLITDGAPTVNTDCVATGEGPGGNNSPADAETQPIISEIEQALSENDVRTFLIGSPGSEESSGGNSDMRPWLSKAAVVGGTPADGCMEDGPNFCHMDMTQESDFGAALTAGLASVTGQIVNACEFLVPEPSEAEGEIEPDQTNLIVTWGDGTSTLILPDGMGDCEDGWQWNADQGTVSLCGETCDQVKLDERASVKLTFGCTTDEILGPLR